MTRATLASGSFPAFLAFVALAVLLLAGCSGSGHAPTTPGVSTSVDFIVPGTWDVRGATDYMFAWAHNADSASVAAPWSITAVNGTLPAGWNFTFAPASSTLAANGTRAGGNYADWGATRITLQLPASQPAATVDVVLHAGPASHPERIVVSGSRGSVAGPGSKVSLHYVGKFEDGGTFDQGDFDTTLGAGKTVPGFDNGLMGLAVGETATLHIPPAFAYGYDNPPGNYARFNGKTLIFTVTLKSIA